MRSRVLVCEDIKNDIIIGLPSMKSYILLPMLTHHISGLQCYKICGDEEVAQAVKLGDSVSMTDRNRHKNIETARATSEKMRIYADRFQNGCREKAGNKRHTRGTAVTWKRYFTKLTP